jgi:hypothetical protein
MQLPNELGDIRKENANDGTHGPRLQTRCSPVEGILASIRLTIPASNSSGVSDRNWLWV